MDAPLFAPLDIADLVAVLALVVTARVLDFRIERQVGRPSVTILMMRYRRDWMVEMITRQPRIFDATILGILRQGTAFFASTAVIAIGGVLALIGNASSLAGLAMALGGAPVPDFVWQLKLALVAILLTDGFLKFVWSNRLFGYCAVVMAAVPNDVDDPAARPRAAQAAELNIRAAWNFNRGLRSLYFALAALAWLIGPGALALATMVTAIIIWKREFASISHAVLSQSETRP